MDDSDPQHAKNGSWVSANAVAHERELRELELVRVHEKIDHLHELVTEFRDSSAKALELQAAEYERRLEALNHEHSRATEALRLTVPREVFDNFRGETHKAREETNRVLAEAKGLAEGERSARQKQGAALTVGLTILSIVIGVIMRFVQ